MVLMICSDCIFPAGSRFGRLAVETAETDQADVVNTSTIEEVKPESPLPMTTGSRDLGPSTVTLSGLLNAIDGVSSQVS
jgi:chaperone BCS1